MEGSGDRSPGSRVDIEGLAKGASEPFLQELRRDALHMLWAALDAVDPRKVVAQALRRRRSTLEVLGHAVPLPPPEGLHLLAPGKGAAGMVSGALSVVDIPSGLVVTNQDYSPPRPDIRVIRASHPIPDGESLRAGREALALADRLGPDDLLLVLVSGGGSAMLEATPLSLEDLQEVYRLLLRSGLAIREVNEVRRAISEVKGGRLAGRAVARGATLVALVVSDIVGDPLEDIASGLTVPTASRGEDAEGILRRAGVWDQMPEAARRVMEAAAQRREHWGRDKQRVHNFLVANNSLACRAAVDEAGGRGYRARLITKSLEGDAHTAGRWLLEEALGREPGALRAAFVAGGETTVQVHGGGRGGRNQEMVLSVVEALEGRPMVFLSCGTDGIDGNTQAAGAIADGGTMARARTAGLDPRRFLEDNNSYEFFRNLGDLIVTGPTGTNVSDIQILVRGRPGVSP